MGFDEKSSYYVVLTGGGWVGTKEVDNFPLSEPRFHNFTTDRPLLMGVLTFSLSLELL